MEVIKILNDPSSLGDQADIQVHVCMYVCMLTEPNFQHLARMSQNRTYEDHIILQAISQSIQVQLLIVSSSNDRTTLITPTGTTLLNPKPHPSYYPVIRPSNSLVLTASD